VNAINSYRSDSLRIDHSIAFTVTLNEIDNDILPKATPFSYQNIKTELKKYFFVQKKSTLFKG